MSATPIHSNDSPIRKIPFLATLDSQKDSQPDSWGMLWRTDHAIASNFNTK